MVVPLIKREDQRVCCNYTSVTLFSLQGVQEEDVADTRTSDSGGTVRTSARLQNTGPAPRFTLGAQGFIGDHPTSPQVHCRFGEGVGTCPSIRLGGGGASPVGPLVRAVQSLHLI